MLNGSILGNTTLLFGSALSFEAAEKLPFWVGTTLGASTAFSWYIISTEGCCKGIFKAYHDAGNDPNYQGSRWLTRLVVVLSKPLMCAGIVIGLSGEMLGREGLSPKIGIPVALALIPNQALPISIGYDLGATLLIWSMGRLFLREGSKSLFSLSLNSKAS